MRGPVSSLPLLRKSCSLCLNPAVSPLCSTSPSSTSAYPANNSIPSPPQCKLTLFSVLLTLLAVPPSYSTRYSSLSLQSSSLSSPHNPAYFLLSPTIHSIPNPCSYLIWKVNFFLILWLASFVSLLILLLLLLLLLSPAVCLFLSLSFPNHAAASAYSM